MTDPSGSSSRFRMLFEWALRDYEKQTRTELVEHPLAQRLQGCRTIESVVGVLREQVAVLSGNGDGDGDRIMKSLRGTVSVLHKLSKTAVLGKPTDLPFPPTKAIYTALAILLAAVNRANATYDGLVDLLETTERFLDYLHIYTKISPTRAADETVIKIMVELLSTLALATKQIKQKQSVKFTMKLLGENYVKSVLQRLDRLSLEEARTTAVQTLEVVYSLIQNMKVVMNDRNASSDSIRSALERLHQIASDLHRPERDMLQQDVRHWLSPPDPWKNHNITCESHHPGTGSWFIQSDTLSEWKSSGQSSLLWIHSKPGGGKSVLCSRVIQDIEAMRKSGLAALAFFYCDFREDQKKDRHGLLSSLLVQLCHQSNSYSDILSAFYLEHASGSRQPSDDALAGCLKDLLKIPGQAPVYLIVDALDECPNTSATTPSPRERVLMLVEELVDSRISDLSICVTSRPEMDIKGILDPLSFRSISLHDETGQIEDINFYIKSVVNTDLVIRAWKAEDRQLVIDLLTEKADGNFRWVYLQLDFVRGCLPGRIRHVMAELPKTLDEVYDRTSTSMRPEPSLSLDTLVTTNDFLSTSILTEQSFYSARTSPEQASNGSNILGGGYGSSRRIDE